MLFLLRSRRRPWHPQLFLELVCPKVAGEANRGMDPSGLLVDCSSGLAHLVFLFCGISSVIFGCMGSATNAVAPDWTVGRKVLLGLTVYWEIYRRDLEAVFELLAFGKRWPDLWLILLPASRSLKAPFSIAEDIKLNTVGARTQPCLRRWRLGKNLTVHHHQGLGLACPPGTGEGEWWICGAAKLAHGFAQSVSADCVECLREIHRGGVEVAVLFQKLSLQLAGGNYHVDCSLTCMETHGLISSVT